MYVNYLDFGFYLQRATERKKGHDEPREGGREKEKTSVPEANGDLEISCRMQQQQHTT
jgi:hypothetical protein